jgi:hypothetical protein
MSKQQGPSCLTEDDRNELLNKIDEYRSYFDNLGVDLPDRLIEKLQDVRDKLENVRLNNAGLFTELISLFLANFLLEGGSNNASFIGDIA